VWLSLLLGLGSGLCWGAADFGGGLVSRRLPTLAVTAVSQSAGFAALLVVLAVAVSGLVRDSRDAHTGAPDWSTPAPRATVPAGGDARLAAYVRLVEAHLSARAPDPELRDRLAALCDQRLERRHGLDRRDPAARDAVRGLLGDRLLSDLTGPPRRLRPVEVDEHLRRIEAL
jgi:hypothetical protein